MKNELQFVQESFELKTGEVDSRVIIMSGVTPAVHLDRRGTIRLLENLQKQVQEIKLSDTLHLPINTRQVRGGKSNKTYAEVLTSGKPNHQREKIYNGGQTDGEGCQNREDNFGFGIQRQRGCYNGGLTNHV